MGASQSSSSESDTNQILLENSDDGETKITKRRLSVDELHQLSKELKSATDNNVTLDVDLYKSIGSDLGIEFEEDTDDEEEYEDDEQEEYEVFEVTELIDPIQVPIELNEAPLTSQIAPAIELPPPVFVNESAGLEIGTPENSSEQEHEFPDSVETDVEVAEDTSVSSEALAVDLEIPNSDADDVQSSDKVETVEQVISEVGTTVEETSATEVEIVGEEQTVMKNKELGEEDVGILPQEATVMEPHVEESVIAEQVIDEVALEETVEEEIQVVEVCEDLPREEEESMIPVVEIAKEPDVETDEEVAEAPSGYEQSVPSEEHSLEVGEVIHEANEDEFKELPESSLNQTTEDLPSSEDVVEHVGETVSREPEQIVKESTDEIAEEIVPEKESIPEEKVGMVSAVDDEAITDVPFEPTPGVEDIREVTEELTQEMVKQEVMDMQISESKPVDTQSESIGFSTEVELDGVEKAIELDDVEKAIVEHIPDDATELETPDDADISGNVASAVTEVYLEEEVSYSEAPSPSPEGSQPSEEVVPQADVDVESVGPIVDEAVVERGEMEITPVFESIVEVIESAIEDVMELVPINKSEADSTIDATTETPTTPPEIVTDESDIEPEQVEEPVMEITVPEIESIDEPVTVSEVIPEPVINEVTEQPSSESQSDIPELVHEDPPSIPEESPLISDNIPEPVLEPVGEADTEALAEIPAVDEEPIVEAIAAEPVVEAVLESSVEQVVEPVIELAAEQEAAEPVIEPVIEPAIEPISELVSGPVVESLVAEPLVELPVEEPVVELSVEEPVVEQTPEPEVEAVKEEGGGETGTSLFSIIQQAIEPYFTSKPDEKETVISEESETEVVTPCETETAQDVETPDTTPETTLLQPNEVVEIIEAPPVIEKVAEVAKEAVVASELPTRKDLAESLFGQFQKQEVEKIITEAKLEGARSQANLDADVMSSTLNAERSRWRGRFRVIEENLKKRKEDISSAHEQGIAMVTSKLDLPETKESCADSVKSITDCYLTNPTEVLRCNSLTQSFDACVSNALAQR